MVSFLLVKSHEIYEISGNLLKSVKSLEIRINSTDFKIYTPFGELVTPQLCLESKFCYPTIINSQKIIKVLDHGNLELYGNDDLCSFVNRVLSTGSECQSIGFIVSI